MVSQKETLACYAFSCFGKLNPFVFKKIINFLSPNKFYYADQKKLNKLLGAKLANEFVSFRANFDVKSAYQKLKQIEINYLSFFDDSYPYLLKQIPDPPIGLFYKGNLLALKKNSSLYLAIVGSRQPSEYGCKITINWSRKLSRKGLVLVSGMALGIDTLVHQQALWAKAPTIAVLGCGLNNIYPAKNSRLYWQIVQNKGLVISEFVPEARVSRQKFVSRNRIISGLCRATLLIEGTNHSGTLITARYALEQGREVFVLPGRVDNPLSAACLTMLKLGATPAVCVEDLLGSGIIET